jgi:hypothetical protein
MLDNIYKCTPREARVFISDCLEAGLVPMLHGSPGIGKSAIMKLVAEDYNLAMIDHRLSTSAPEDLTGLPGFDANGYARFSPFADLFPIEGTPLDENKSGWMIFFDEMNSANKSVQAASYKVILDKMVGQHRLHSNVVLTAAGNLSTDRAIVNPLSTAMQSRLVHLILECDFQEWLTDVALAQNYDSRILAYLSYKPSSLMDFRPDHNENTFCCPRTWEFMNRLIKGKAVTEEKTKLYGGTITSGVAVDFVQFTKVYEHLPNINVIVGNPTGVAIPGDSATKYATISHLLEKVSEDIFDPVATYVNRFGAEFRVLFFRGLMVKRPAWRKHPAFQKAMLELSRYLND